MRLRTCRQSFTNVMLEIKVSLSDTEVLHAALALHPEVVAKVGTGDLPPLKWSSLKYVFRMEDKIDGKEEAYG